MIRIQPQYLTDRDGNKTSVLLSMEEFEAILEKLDDADDIRLFDEAMKEPSEDSISLDDYMKMRGLLNE